MIILSIIIIINSTRQKTENQISFNSSDNTLPQDSLLSKKTMKFVISSPQEATITKVTTLVLTEAFKRIGYEYEVISYPQKRSILLMESGEVDGDATRIYDFNVNNEHPYYIRVNESYAKIYWSAFVTDPEIEIQSWDDLKNGNYRIGYLSGVKYCEQKLIGFIDEDKLLPQFDSNFNGLKQLDSGRIDIYIYTNSDQAKYDLDSEELQNSKIMLAGHLDYLDVYPYLQKKHESLAETLAETIRDIKAEGLYDKFKSQLNSF